MERSAALRLMLFLRCVYAATIIFAALQGRWSIVIINAPVFAGSLFVPYLGRKDRRYYAVDAYAMAVFSLFALIPPALWPLLREGELFGIDKLFHVAGGAGLAWFAAILYDRHVKDPFIFALSVILAVLALGAAWEVFEWVLWKGGLLAVHTLDDTILDLAADTLGGAITWAVWYRFK